MCAVFLSTLYAGIDDTVSCSLPANNQIRDDENVRYRPWRKNTAGIAAISLSKTGITVVSLH